MPKAVKKEKVESLGALPPVLDHWEPVPSMLYGEPAREPAYDDDAGRERAKVALRAKALKLGVKVSRIIEKCEYDFKKRRWQMHYHVEVLGRARA